MRVRKFCVLLVLVILISSAAIIPLSLADDPPHTSDWSTNPPTADSLVIGVPYEDGGAATDAGVMQIVYGYVGSTGLDFNNSEYFGQTSSTGGIETDDYFSKGLAVGDFNRDGYYDIAAGAPGDNNGPFTNVGSVNIFYGSKSGFVTTNDDYFAFTDIDPDGGSDNDNFGAALTTGDFNGDGYPDLAVSAPGYDGVSGGNILTDTGAVVIFWGHNGGLSELSRSVYTGNDSDSEYGYALAAADFNGDNHDDLVIGAPNNSTPAPIGSPARGGAVYILTPFNNNQAYWHQTLVGGDGGENGDRFGASLATGDFNGDGHPDLAVGAPGEDLNGAPFSVSDVGAVSVIYNDGHGLSATNAQFWWQSDVNGNYNPHNLSEAFDQFGYALTDGDFDNDGCADLAIGVPYEDVTVTVNGTETTYNNIGLVQLIPGTTAGLTTTNHGIDLSPRQSDAGDNQYRGYSLASGDFDKDGKDDIAVGVPGYSTTSATSAGAVRYCYAITMSASFRSITCSQPKTQSSPANPEAYDQYGWALTVLPAPLSHKIYLPLVLR